MLQISGNLWLTITYHNAKRDYSPSVEIGVQQGGAIVVRQIPFELNRKWEIPKDDELPHLIAGVLIGTTPLFLLADRFRELGFESVADVIGNCAKKQQMA